MPIKRELTPFVHAPATPEPVAALLADSSNSEQQYNALPYSSPIYRLPVELLRQIFILAIDNSPLHLIPSFSDATQFRLAAVCSQWRYVILDLPTVWSNIAFSTAWHSLIDVNHTKDGPRRWRMTHIPTALRVLDLCLARCGTQPVQLLYRNWHLARESWGLLKNSPLNSRISKLHVATCVTHLGRIPRLATWLGSPALREVHIQGVACRDSTGREFWSPPKISINIQSFTLEGIVPTRYLFTEVHRPSLRQFRLVVHNNWRDRECHLPILGYLSIMPRLKTLDIRGLHFLDHANQFRPGEPVLLEELEYLLVKGARRSLWWVGALVTPKLRAADVDIGTSESDVLVSTDTDVTPGILAESAARSLTSLVVRHWSPDIDILLTRAAPNLQRLVTHLSLWRKWPEYNIGGSLKLPSLRQLDLLYQVPAFRPELYPEMTREEGEEYTLGMWKRVCRCHTICALRDSEAVAPALEIVSVFRNDGKWEVDDMGTPMVIVSKHEATRVLERGEADGCDDE